MARITVEDCLLREQNRFALVLLAARRAKQLLAGSQVQGGVGQHKNKSVVMALREIADGVVRFMSSEEKEAFLKKQREDIERRAREAAAARPAQVTATATSGADALFRDPLAAVEPTSDAAATNGSSTNGSHTPIV